MKYFLAFFFLSILPAFAQHQHPPQDQAIHERFYKDWMMPDAPFVSCCNEKDCKPAQSKFENDGWLARWKDEDPWFPVPASKVDETRDSPDGRSHMCGAYVRYSAVFVVFCFVRGNAS